jgi:hypothetical protein
MGRSNKYNVISTLITLYFENKVKKHNRDCYQSSSLEISKKYNLLHII